MNQTRQTDNQTVVWAFRTLGRIELVGAPSAPNVSAAAWAVLAYVCVHQRPVSRKELIRELFGEQRQQAHVLRNAIFVLRHWLGDALEISRSGLALAPWVQVVVDAEQFLQTTHGTATLVQLVAAADRYRGAFLVRPLYGWCLWYAQVLYERYIATLYRIVQLQANDTQQVTVVRFLKLLLQECPWDVTLHERYLYVLTLYGMNATARAYLKNLQQHHERDPSMSAEWFAQMHTSLLDVTEARDTNESETRVRARLQSFRDNLFHVHTTVIDQLQAHWQSFVLGSVVGKKMQLVGIEGSGKTYIAHAFQQAPTAQVRVLLGKPVIEAEDGDEFVRRLRVALRGDQRFAELAQMVLTQLPMIYRAGMERIGSTPAVNNDGFEHFIIQKELIRTVLQHMAQRVALVLICDDVSEDFLSLLDSYTQGIALGICVTSTSEHVWDTSEIIVVPRLGRYDIATMIETTLNGDAYDGALVELVTEACRTPEDVRYMLMQLVQRQELSWDGEQQRWCLDSAVHQGRLPRLFACPATVLAVLQLFAVMQEALSASMLGRVQWLVVVDVAEALVYLQQHGLLLSDDQGYRLSPAWVSSRVIEDMSVQQREQAHRHALQCSEGLVQVEHAIALGEVTLAHTLLVTVTDVAWRYGNALRLRRAVRLMQRLLEHVDDADIRWLQALTVVRLARFGAPVSEVAQALAVLNAYQYRSPQHAVECMLHVALVLRWAGFPRETMDILTQIHPQASALQLSRSEFQIVNALIYASLDYGAIADGMKWLERLYAPPTEPLEKVVVGLTRSYVLARLGQIDTARATVAQIRAMAGDANVRTVAMLAYYTGLVECAALAYGACIEHLRIAWQRTFEVGEVLTHLMAGALLCMAHARHGQFGALVGMVGIVMEQATSLQLARQRLLATSAYVRLLVAQAQYDQALAVLEEAYQVAAYHELREYAVCLAGLAMMTHRQRGASDALWRQRLEQSQQRVEAYQVGLWYHELAWDAYQRGQTTEAVEQALAAIEYAEHFRMQPISPLEVMMQAWAVLQRCRYPHLGPLTARIGRALVVAMQAVSDPFQRQRFLALLPDVDAFCEVPLTDEQQGVWRLPYSLAPRGKPLQTDDFVPVILVLKPAYREMTLVAQIEHIVAQAAQQQACVMVKQLAHMLHVHERTILRALKQARASGISIDTFRPRVTASTSLPPNNLSPDLTL